MKRPFDNALAEMLVMSCRSGFGDFFSGQLQGILKALAASLQEQLSQGASQSLKIGPLYRGGPVFQSSNKGGLAL